jgi:hypothetical protein
MDCSRSWPRPFARAGVEQAAVRLCRRASPIFFGPRIPDFVSRFVALSNFMRLSFERKPHARRVYWCEVGNPGNAGTNVGHPWRAVGPVTCLRGRPAVSHIWQNRADMGHPAIGEGIEPKSRSSRTLLLLPNFSRRWLGAQGARHARTYVLSGTR